jgi:hypothetical protein
MQTYLVCRLSREGYGHLVLPTLKFFLVRVDQAPSSVPRQGLLNQAAKRCKAPAL